MGFVTVNTKSLVVIPKSVRDEAGIFPGDKLKVYFDKEDGAVVMKKMDDVKEMSESISGMWSDNKFKLEEARESSDERIDNILKKKLQQKGLA
jgi:AbrB family looped-hinge helix DNA binding protein